MGQESHHPRILSLSGMVLVLPGLAMLLWGLGAQYVGASARSDVSPARWVLAAFGGLTFLFGALLHGKAVRDATKAKRAYGRTVLFVLVPVGLGLIAVVAATECGLRILRQYGVPLGDYRRFDAVLGWSLIPNREYHVVSRAKGFDVNIRIGPSGFREDGQDVQTPRQADVVLVGDSNVFGFGQRNDQTLSAQLHQLLALRRVGAKVLNAGVPGYGLDQYLLRMRSLGPLRPGTVLVVLVHPVNDLVNLSCETDYHSTRPRMVVGAEGVAFHHAACRKPDVDCRFAAEFSSLNEFFKLAPDGVGDPHRLELLQWLYRLNTRSTVRSDGVTEMIDTVSPEDYLKAARRNVERKPLEAACRYWPEMAVFDSERKRLERWVRLLVVEMNRCAKASSARLVVVVAPEPYQVCKYDRELVGLLRELLPELQFQWGWSRSCVIEALRRGELEHLCPGFPPAEAETMFVANDGHIAADGFRIIANDLAELLDRKGWIEPRNDAADPSQ